jgi:hypothetical protein
MDIPALIRWRPKIEALLAKNAAVAFWVYGPRLPDTLRVLEGWGLTYSSELLLWIKASRSTGEPSIGTGKTTRKIGESMWLAKRGKGLPIRDRSVSQGIFAPRQGHSAKPDEAYNALERLWRGSPDRSVCPHRASGVGSVGQRGLGADSVGRRVNGRLVCRTDPEPDASKMPLRRR